MTSRRQFLSAGAVALGAIGTGLYTFRIEPYWLEIVERSLPVAGLPTGLRGASLVHLSDPHVGPHVPDDYILETFTRVRALEPDIVAYTADLTSFERGIVDRASHVYRDAPSR